MKHMRQEYDFSAELGCPDWFGDLGILIRAWLR